MSVCISRVSAQKSKWDSSRSMRYNQDAQREEGNVCLRVSVCEILQLFFLVAWCFPHVHYFAFAFSLHSLFSLFLLLSLSPPMFSSLLLSISQTRDVWWILLVISLKWDLGIRSKASSRTRKRCVAECDTLDMTSSHPLNTRCLHGFCFCFAVKSRL